MYLTHLLPKELERVMAQGSTTSAPREFDPEFDTFLPARAAIGAAGRPVRFNQAGGESDDDIADVARHFGED